MCTFWIQEGAIDTFRRFFMTHLSCKRESQLYSKERLEAEAWRRDAGSGEMGVEALGLHARVWGLLLWQGNTILSCGFAAAYILMPANELPSLQPDLLRTVK